MTLQAPVLTAPAKAGHDAVSEALAVLLADLFVLYVKTKNFHWHAHGPHFRDHHLLLDEQATQVFAAVDAVAERARKRGAPALHSIGEIARRQRITDNDAEHVTSRDMLDELRGDNGVLLEDLRATHRLAVADGDIATASLIETWVDEAEGRIWFLLETARLSNAEA
jgi:starvation-inducible DNA-binding protein